MVGRIYRVLVENTTDKEGILAGRTSGNIIVEFAGGESLVGEFADVKITEARNWILRGELARDILKG